MHVHGIGRWRRTRALLYPRRDFDGRIGHADRLDRHRLGHEGAVGHEEGVARAVRRLELPHHVSDRAEADDQRRIGAVVPEVHAPDEADALRRHALAQEFLARGAGEWRQRVLQQGPGARLQRRFHGLLAHRGPISQAHAVGG
jgi:hypothetical protein